MYYPYFRGKQFDLLALKTLAEKKLLSNKIIPIIEPVKNSATLKGTLKSFTQNQQPYYLIANPQAGDFLTASGSDDLTTLPGQRLQILTVQEGLLKADTALFYVDQSAALANYEVFDQDKPTIVPMEFRLLNKITGPKILSEDPFTRIRNSFYSEVPDEFFSNNYQTFAKRGFVGFSDFTIDSRIYYEQSYPSKTLVIHLVYEDEQGLRIHHFTGGSHAEEASQREQFLILMEKIDQFEPLLSTAGLDLLKEYRKNERFPGMGVIRKASVMHYLETMGQVLK